VLRLNKVAALDTEEPLYQLALDALKMPDVTGFDLIPLQDAPLPLMLAWRADYCEEALAFPNEEAMEQAVTDIAAYVARDSHRVLLRDGQPVAMTGFNATLPDVVQIGGVYTPPALRRLGYARRALALHLAEVRSQGVTDAVLFAANEAAAKAYEAIGFRHAGTYSIVRYDSPQVIHG